MQVNLPDDSLVRETMTSLGPGAKDATLDDLAAWICQLEELCDSKDAALAPPVIFRTDIRVSCLSKVPTAAQATKLQTKAVKGYSPLPELHMEIVSSKKKNARGEAKMRLSVERGPVLVLLTITNLHGATRTLCVVTEDGNDLIPIKHPATTIEATVVPFAPKQLLDRLRLVESKTKPQREEPVRPSASPQPVVEEASAQRQADGVEYIKTRHGSLLIEKTVHPETRTMTIKSSGCPDPHCDGVNCTEAPISVSLLIRNGEIMSYTASDPRMNGILAQMIKSYMDNPHLGSEIHRRKEAILKEEKAIKQKLPTAKPAEKKRLLKELEDNNGEFAKLTDLLFRTTGGGWKSVPQEQISAMIEKAKRKDPKRAEALARRAQAGIDEYNVLVDKHKSTSNPTKKKRLATLLGRKEIEFDEAINEIAVIAGKPLDAD